MDQKIFPKMVIISALIIAVIGLAALYFTDFHITLPKFLRSDSQDIDISERYLVHKDINVTFFWVGEKADSDNDYIANSKSAWDKEWKKHFGGEDTPKDRNGYLPAGFKPKENPFYFALPYNDFDDDGRKPEAKDIVYWSGEKEWKEGESMLKNRWIAITKGGKTAYAQWEDVGPFGEEDADYVFGDALPKSKENKNAGLDVSPAVRDYLGLDGIDKVDWQFVDGKDVPKGPWKDIITTSQLNF